MNLTAILASIVVIVLPLWFTIPWTFYKCWIVWGAYVDWKIYICDVDENTEFYRLHEAGHKVWEEYLTEDQKEQYTKLYRNHRQFWVEAFYREYSKMTVKEDFADNLALMIQKENSNPYVMKRIRLIKFLTK